MDNPNDKKVGLFATTFLIPAGEWVITAGAAMVAIGLTINASIAAKKAQKGSTRSGTETKQI
ncbi:hypothetical protein [Alicyclobacillus mengziensis]|uniref:Uncharacterized protein n=1 Tax=Alicyclobacillus mengziensis TaxID=2931921 RepID=A0A9X7VUJ1_9BACL|nr:hypothetical protein [Alicyclobacillus mengziensis]QSO45489.1 hypothetical protein JZ786_12985 [Alicyclobacillus mengziensis]